MIVVAEETATSQAQAPAAEPKASKKAARSRRGAHGAPKKGKSGEKSSPAKKASKRAKKGAGARDDSKAAKILELLRRPGGASSKDLQKATGWQPHSVRGFLSTAAKKRGVKIESAKNEAGDRVYKIGK